MPHSVGVHVSEAVSRSILVWALKATLEPCEHNLRFLSTYCTRMLSQCALKPLCHSCVDEVSTQPSVPLTTSSFSRQSLWERPQKCERTQPQQSKLNVDTQTIKMSSSAQIVSLRLDPNLSGCKQMTERGMSLQSPAELTSAPLPILFILLKMKQGQITFYSSGHDDRGINSGI